MFCQNDNFIGHIGMFCRVQIWIMTSYNNPEDVDMTMPTNVNNLSLYHYQGCPYCVVTRKALGQLDIDVAQRDIIQQPKYRSELMIGGGKTQVPCLRIEGENGKVSWMYESADIIKYLRQYAKQAA